MRTIHPFIKLLEIKNRDKLPALETVQNLFYCLKIQLLGARGTLRASRGLEFNGLIIRIENPASRRYSHPRLMPLNNSTPNYILSLIKYGALPGSNSLGFFVKSNLYSAIVVV
jgi:hypothetical protein